jgi:hypothetical protein
MADTSTTVSLGPLQLIDSDPSGGGTVLLPFAPGISFLSKCDATRLNASRTSFQELFSGEVTYRIDPGIAEAWQKQLETILGGLGKLVPFPKDMMARPAAGLPAETLPKQGFMLQRSLNAKRPAPVFAHSIDSAELIKGFPSSCFIVNGLGDIPSDAEAEKVSEVEDVLVCCPPLTAAQTLDMVAKFHT